MEIDTTEEHDAAVPDKHVSSDLKAKQIFGEEFVKLNLEKHVVAVLFTQGVINSSNQCIPSGSCEMLPDSDDSSELDGLVEEVPYRTYEEFVTGNKTTAYQSYYDLSTLMPNQRKKNRIKKIIPKTCAACSMSKVEFPERIFFPFPNTASLCQEWAKFCKAPHLEVMPPLRLHKCYSICSAHFVKDDYASEYSLKYTACPTEPTCDTIENRINKEMVLKSWRAVVGKKLNTTLGDSAHSLKEILVTKTCKADVNDLFVKKNASIEHDPSVKVQDNIAVNKNSNNCIVIDGRTSSTNETGTSETSSKILTAKRCGNIKTVSNKSLKKCTNITKELLSTYKTITNRTSTADRKIIAKTTTDLGTFNKARPIIHNIVHKSTIDTKMIVSMDKNNHNKSNVERNIHEMSVTNTQKDCRRVTKNVLKFDKFKTHQDTVSNCRKTRTKLAQRNRNNNGKQVDSLTDSSEEPLSMFKADTLNILRSNFSLYRNNLLNSF